MLASCTHRVVKLYSILIIFRWLNVKTKDMKFNNTLNWVKTHQCGFEEKSNSMNCFVSSGSCVELVAQQHDYINDDWIDSIQCYPI